MRLAQGTGARLGSYEIVAPLGAGEMGEVYRARDTKPGCDVALRFCPRRLRATTSVVRGVSHWAWETKR